MTAAPDPHRVTDEPVEWVGGIVTLPTYIKDNGEIYRPSAILWIDAATEMIVGTEVVPPQGALGAAAANLRAAAQSPITGTPATLRRVRVASQELADALRREPLDGVDVVCAPTPELDRAADSLIERLAPSDEPPDLHYLGPESDVSVEAAGAMFRAAARLYRTKPWEIVPSDNTLIGITSEPLGLSDAVVSVIGQAGKVHGFLLFASLDDFHLFGDASDQDEQGEAAKYPRHLALTYARRDDVGPTLLDEIAAHRWQVAGARAYPVITWFDADAVGRNPTQAEMLRMEAIAAALAEIFAEYTPELGDALHGGSCLVFGKQLGTSGGEIRIEVLVPARGEVPDEVPDEALVDDDGQLDGARVAAYRTAILARFEGSPEARAEPAASWGALLVDYAVDYFGKTVAALSPSEVREIAFELVPRKVSVEPTAAPAIVAGLRAFLAFTRREHPGGHAERCLALLEGNAAQRLARLLADPSNFGPAKSFVMSGQAAGFDMTSQAGVNAWSEHMRRHDLRLPMGFPLPVAPRREAATTSRAARRSKKTKRKAQRAARNKSRSR